MFNRLSQIVSLVKDLSASLLPTGSPFDEIQSLRREVAQLKNLLESEVKKTHGRLEGLEEAMQKATEAKKKARPKRAPRKKQTE